MLINLPRTKKPGTLSFVIFMLNNHYLIGLTGQRNEICEGFFKGYSGST